MIASNGYPDWQFPALELPRTPYRGIEPFRFIDQPIFCARTDETRKLIRSTTIYRGVLLYGASGSGKSSLINAGLIPQLVRDGFFCERIRVQPHHDEEMIIERIPLTQDGRPPYLPSFFDNEKDEPGAVKNILEMVMPSFFGDSEAEARIVLPVMSFLTQLRENAKSRSVLLIFDQFEEFVTLFEDAPQVQSQQKAKEIQQRILAGLVELLRNQTLPIKLLFSFREDYLARLSALFRQCPDLTDQYLRLTSPDKGALLEIIRGPFKSERAREHFGREMSGEIVQGLAIEIENRDDSDLLNLSEVEIVCDRLWHADDPIQILKKRGVQGLLEDYLSDELVRLKDLRDPAIALLGRMVTSAGTRNVISEANLLEQVNKEERLAPDVLKTALTALEKDTRLVQRERRNKVYFYEIVSEFLVPWIFRQKGLWEATRERKIFRRRAFATAALIFLVAMAAWYWQFTQISVKNLRIEIGIIKQDRDDTLQKLDAGQDALQASEKALNQVRTDLHALQLAEASLQSRQKGLQVENAVLTNRIEATTQALNNAQRMAQDRQSEIDRQVALIQQERSSHQEDLLRLQRQLAEQERTAQTAIDNLTEQKNQMERRLQSENRRALDELSAKTSEARQLQEELQKNKNESQEQIVKLNRDLNIANATVNAFRNEKADLVNAKEKAEADANQAHEDLLVCQSRSGEPTSPPSP